MAKKLSLSDVAITTGFQVQVPFASAVLLFTSKFHKISQHCLFRQYTLSCLAYVETRLAKQRKNKTG